MNIKNYIPFIATLIGITTVVVKNGGIAALTVTFLITIMGLFLVSNEKKEFGKTFIKGMQNPMLLTLIGSFLLSGILSQIFIASRIVQAILWVMSSLSISIFWIPAFAFGLSLLISFVCGTSAGTISTVLPLFLTLGIETEIKAELLVGVIVSGAVMGNVLSPLSDVIISTVLTTKSTINNVIKGNLMISIEVAIITIILLSVFGINSYEPGVITLSQLKVNKRSLALLSLPIIMMVLIKKKWNLVSTLLVCDSIGITFNLLLKNITVSSLLTEDGILYKGMLGMQSIILYSMMLFWIIEIIKKEGIFEVFLEKIAHRCKNKRGAKFTIWFGTILGVMFTAGGSSGIMVFGSIASELAQRFDIEKEYVTRTLSIISASMVSILPYGTTYILSTGLVKQLFGIQLLYKDCVPMIIFCDICVLAQLIAVFTSKERGKIK